MFITGCGITKAGNAWIQPLNNDTTTYTYTWADSSGAIQQMHTGNNGDTLATPNTGSYTVNMKTLNGCDTAILINVSFPRDTISFIADTVACAHSLIQFTNTSIGSNLSYLWNFGDGRMDTTIDPAHAYNEPGSYIATLVACMDTFSRSVIVDTMPYVSFTVSPKEVCEGKEITFYPSYLPGSSLVWDFGDGFNTSSLQPHHAYDISGQMIVTATAKSKYNVCFDTSFSDTVQVDPYPIVNIGPDTAMCPGQDPIPIHNLANEISTDYAYLWNTGSIESNILAGKPGTYWLQVTSAKGCSTTDSIDVKPDCYIGIPNAFTPNGDGINDYFFPRDLLAGGLTAFHMQVFNRWGQLLFETTNTTGRGWDGKFNNADQPQGVYIYMIEANFINGTQAKYQGNVTLIK